MLLVVDANILVAELLRVRGRLLLKDPRLNLSMTEVVWSEATHELARRLQSMQRLHRITDNLARAVQDEAAKLKLTHIEQVAHEHYASWERIARRRIPRDPRNWPTVALALALDGGIWTEDGDFLGCGLPTWTTVTLLAHLEDEPAQSATPI